MVGFFRLAVLAAMLVSSSVFAGEAPSSSSSAAGVVPELDGGLALLALGLTAAIVAIVRERRRAR